jgi:hypothetical protein
VFLIVVKYKDSLKKPHGQIYFILDYNFFYLIFVVHKYKLLSMNTLAFMRPATKKKDGHDGVLYMHNFVTGFQELVFDNHEAARKYAKADGALHILRQAPRRLVR